MAWVWAVVSDSVMENGRLLGGSGYACEGMDTIGVACWVEEQRPYGYVWEMATEEEAYARLERFAWEEELQGRVVFWESNGFRAIDGAVLRARAERKALAIDTVGRLSAMLPVDVVTVCRKFSRGDVETQARMLRQCAAAEGVAV